MVSDAISKALQPATRRNQVVAPRPTRGALTVLRIATFLKIRIFNQHLARNLPSSRKDVSS